MSDLLFRWLEFMSIVDFVHFSFLTLHASWESLSFVSALSFLSSYYLWVCYFFRFVCVSPMLWILTGFRFRSHAFVRNLLFRVATRR